MTGPDDLARAVEALLFASEVPLAATDIAGRLDVADVDEALSAIAARHAGHGIELVERGGRWHFQTPADLAHLLRETRESARRLSRAGVETLAIIAYNEPVSRAEIEAIRGVQISKGTLDVLIEAGWIAPAGRRQVPGRPLTYATTADFLSHFGLADRRDLPGIDDLRAAGLLDPMADDWEMGENKTELESADESD
jgi:segregation and condensation protein B